MGISVHVPPGFLPWQDAQGSAGVSSASGPPPSAGALPPPSRGLFSSSEPSGPGVPSAQGWPHRWASLAAPGLRIPSGQETNASSGTSGSRGHFPRPMSGCRRGRGTRVRASAHVCASWLPVRRPQGAGGRGAALHPRAGVPRGSALAPPPGDPRRRRLDRVPAPEDRPRIPETLQCRSWLGLSPRAPRHAEAQRRRGGGRAGKPGSGVDPFRRGRPGGARLCFCCPLVPAPRAPPRASAAIPSPQNTPARRPSGVTS